MKLIKRNSAKMFFGALSILLVICMTFTGCGQNTTPPDNGDGAQNENGGNNVSTNEKQGLESGFNNEDNACASSIFRCAYKSEKNEFEIDDVTLEFFYGGKYILIAEGEYIYGAEYIREKCGHDIPTFDVYFKEDGGEKILIKHVEENLISDKYNVDIDPYGNNPPKYSFSETLTIPEQLFSKESGMIYFMISGTNKWDGDNAKNRAFTWTYIYYKKDNGKVILSNKEFK